MPVVITNQTGRISLLNEAFEQLVGGAHPHLEWIDDLAACFEGSAEARELLSRIQQDAEPWMGEMRIRNELGEPLSVLVRADPVRSSSNRVLGTVLTFSDISERRAATAARQRFQKSILENQRLPSEPLDLATHAVYRRAHSQIISHAQLAALEITDGMQINEIPRLLEQLRSSVTRSAHLLQYMLAHSREAGGDAPDDES
jgi:PAS domain S-box-containing protein